MPRKGKPEYFTVKMKQIHIDRGVLGSERLCPIAHAMRSAGFRDPHVGPFRVSYDWKRGRASSHLPVSAQRFVKLFDSRYDVEPIEFKLRKPK